MYDSFPPRGGSLAKAKNSPAKIMDGTETIINEVRHSTKLAIVCPAPVTERPKFVKGCATIKITRGLPEVR